MPTNLSEAERNSIEKAVRERVTGYGEAVRNRDPEWLCGFWADVEGFTFAGDGEIWTEHKTMADATKAWFEMIAEVLYCEMTNTHVYILGPDAASATTEFAWGTRPHNRLSPSIQPRHLSSSQGARSRF